MGGYNFLWHLARPILPMMLVRRAAAGKEDALPSGMAVMITATTCQTIQSGSMLSALARLSPASRLPRRCAPLAKPPPSF